MTKTKKEKTAQAPDPIEKIGNVTSVSVAKGTGHDWSEWIKRLDRLGGRTLNHQELVKILRSRYRLSLWWQQSVAIHYTYYTGKRVIGQNLKGRYTASIGRTLRADQKKVWKWATSPQGQSVWLRPLSPVHFAKGSEFEIEGGVFGVVRTLTTPSKIRMTWQESDWDKPTIVQLIIVSRPGGKTMFGISHEEIKDARLKAELKEWWRQRLDEVSAHFRPSTKGRES